MKTKKGITVKTMKTRGDAMEAKTGNKRMGKKFNIKTMSKSEG